MYLRAITVIILLLTFPVSCVYHEITRVEVCTSSDLSVLLDQISPATDCSTSSGSISVQVSGGTLPYHYFLNGVEQTGALFSGLRAGIYHVRVTDGRGCEAFLENLTITATNLSFSAAVTADNACPGSNGSVEIAVEGGSPPHFFSTDGVLFTPDNVLTGLAAGEHIVQVKDNTGCLLNLNISIPRGNSSVSWTNDIQPIMTTYCALDGCHNGKSRQDLRLYEKAKSQANRIKLLTRERSMPFEGSLTQEQIDLIGCWVDDGALNN